MRLVVGILSICLYLFGQSPPDLGRSIESLELDPGECYRVRDISIVRDEARTFLTDGFLIFAKPVGGHRVAAVFTADTEGGDAELLLLPPNKAERKSLAAFAKSPNIDEHIHAGLLLFGDSTFRDLMKQIKEAETAKKTDGATLAHDWTPVAQRLAAAFSTRLALELLAPMPGNGFFAEVLSTRNLGNIDLVFDPRSNDQIVLGQLIDQGARSYFQTWTSFVAHSFQHQPSLPEVAIEHYEIDARLDAKLRMRCTSTLTIKIGSINRQAVPLEISAQMAISKATIDGRPAAIQESSTVVTEFLQDALDRLFIVVPDQPLDPAVPHQLRIEHEGDVVSPAGEGAFFVGSRGRWYPHRGAQFSTFAVNYEYPRTLDLVSAGALVSEKSDGDLRKVSRRIDVPVPFLGFNLGNYRCIDRPAQTAAVKVCASATAGSAPEARRVNAMADEIGDVLAYYTAQFGPPPLHDLMVSPIPGTFGQGFAGMIYLSANAYVPLEDPAMVRMGPALQFFYHDLLPAHELAHQWWGNTVSAATNRDEWLMEALANYSAVLWLEKRKGKGATAELLAGYRQGLLSRTEGGQTVESAGPLTQGHRLESPNNPHNYDLITYGKGTWVIHMLRKRMGDEAFARVLQQLVHNFRQKTVTAAEFRQLCSAAMPKDAADRDLEGFFDQWVNSTGIPAIQLKSAVKKSGGSWIVTGILEQTEVEDDFQTEVPVSVVMADGSHVERWIKTSADTATFQILVRSQPARVVLDPEYSVLRR
jgi:hypothetical protein